MLTRSGERPCSILTTLRKHLMWFRVAIRGDSALGRRLRQLANDTDALRGDADEKLLTERSSSKDFSMTASVRSFSVALSKLPSTSLKNSVTG